MPAIENGDSEILLAHELTHIVHASTAKLSGGWERKIATLIIQEGLATRISKEIIPHQAGLPILAGYKNAMSIIIKFKRNPAILRPVFI
jgi:uncharacterized protein YjaZ